ncbi:hypothetical protein KC19_8G101200 [Ceratodon purpureus]|uniref:Uncharacterized protein n=1 Tax=Ceratodon purpureus TaxID=3225 RepID=A0A8T0H0I3_CERPU|nr:hypothetical protein KC19_8G101200 [Ceratodon purpureus]
MAVSTLLAFMGSASAHMYNGSGDGELNILISDNHENAEGIYQCQNGEDFRSEINRVMKILLHNLSQNLEVKDSIASRPAGTQDVGEDIEFSRFSDQSELRDLLPVLTCHDEGDGGHRCPYFPCPYCHRSRSIFVPESKVALITCQEDEVDHQVTALVNGSNLANDMDILFNRSVNDEMFPVTLTWDDEGDGGHRCPYFPCPYCHRSRSIFVPRTDYKVTGSPNVDQESNLDTTSHTHMDYYPMSRIDDQNSVPVLTCPDKGHTCPYFPCPICHRTR